VINEAEKQVLHKQRLFEKGIITDQGR